MMQQEPHSETQGTVFILGFEDAEIFYQTNGERIFSAIRSHRTQPSSLWDGTKWTTARTYGRDG